MLRTIVGRVRLIASAAALLSACSSYEVAKLSPTAPVGGDANGVVFRLGRPEFSLKKIEGSDPAKYQPQVTYVPDPDQRYAIRTKSSPLADVTFDLAFNEQGGLSSSSADTKQQVGPTITALAGFATKAMAASTAIAGLSVKMDALTYPACLGVEGQGAMAACALRVAEQDAPEACAGRPGRLAPRQRLQFFYKDGKDTANPLETLVAATEAEGGCFDAAGKGLKAAAAAVAAAVQTKVVEAAPAAQGGKTDEVNAALQAEVKAFVEAGDVKRARRLVYAVALAGDDPPDPEPLRAILKAPISKEKANQIGAALTAAQLSPDKGVTPVEVVAAGLKVSAALANAAKLDPGPWRARMITNLQAEKLELERRRLLKDPDADAQSDRDVLRVRREIAAMVNMRPEFERHLALERIIARVPALDASERQSRMGEYEAYRKESAAILAELDSRLEATRAKPADKKAQDLPSTVEWVSFRCVEASSRERWLYTYGLEAPPFIVVLKNPATDAPLDPKTSKLECR